MEPQPFKMLSLNLNIRRCDACPIAQEAITPLAGTGNVKSGIVFVAQSPDDDEDIQGRSFISDVGIAFDKALAVCGLNREQVYMTHIVHCHTYQNRLPEDEEIQTCGDLHFRHLMVIMRPYLVVTFGVPAAKYVSGMTSLAGAHGVVQRHDGGFWHIPCYDPIIAMHNPLTKDAYEFDIVQIKRFLSHKDVYLKRLSAPPAEQQLGEAVDI